MASIEAPRSQPFFIPKNEFLVIPEGDISKKDYTFPAIPTRQNWLPFYVHLVVKGGKSRMHQKMAMHAQYLLQTTGFDTFGSTRQFVSAYRYAEEQGIPFMSENEWQFLRQSYAEVHGKHSGFNPAVSNPELFSALHAQYAYAENRLWEMRASLRGVTSLTDFNLAYRGFIQQGRDRDLELEAML